MTRHHQRVKDAAAVVAGCAANRSNKPIASSLWRPQADRPPSRLQFGAKQLETHAASAHVADGIRAAAGDACSHEHIGAGERDLTRALRGCNAPSDATA